MLKKKSMNDFTLCNFCNKLHWKNSFSPKCLEHLVHVKMNIYKPVSYFKKYNKEKINKEQDQVRWQLNSVI